VYPEAARVIDEIRPYPNAYGRFIESVVQPFFGGNATAAKKKLETASPERACLSGVFSVRMFPGLVLTS
jgi:hypothetical protein